MMTFNFKPDVYGFDIECYISHEGRKYTQLDIYRIESKGLRFGKWWDVQLFPFYTYDESISSRDCKKRIYDWNTWKDLKQRVYDDDDR